MPRGRRSGKAAQRWLRLVLALAVAAHTAVAQPQQRRVTITGVRLVGGPDASAGRLEVLVDGRWGSVCVKTLRGGVARTICRQLNVTAWGGGAVRGPAAYGWNDSSPVALAAVACSGLEDSLSQCQLLREQPGVPACEPSDAAGIDCSERSGLLGNAALFDGPSQALGRLEVIVTPPGGGPSAWGQVCRDGFSGADANAACGSMGYRLGGFEHPCDGCYSSAPLLVGSLVCGPNDTSLASCGYVAFDDDGGGGGGGGSSATSSAFCRRYNQALGLFPGVAVACVDDGTQSSGGVQTFAVVGGVAAALLVVMVGVAFYYNGSPMVRRWRGLPVERRSAERRGGELQLGKPSQRWLSVIGPDGSATHVVALPAEPAEVATEAAAEAGAAPEAEDAAAGSQAASAPRRGRRDPQGSRPPPPQV